MPQHSETEEQAVFRYRSKLYDYNSECLWIKTKAAAVTPFQMNYPQKIVHEKLSKQFKERGFIKAIILKARQEGISTYVASRFFRRATLYPNQTGLVIADQKKRGAFIFSIYELYDRNLPEWIRPAKKQGRTGWSIIWDTRDGHGLNSGITVETARDAAAGRGTTVQMVHASEMAFWENPEVVWISLQQAVPDDGSEVIIESTANGVGNMFHQIWEDAVAGENDFIPIFLPWWIMPEYTVENLSVSEKEEITQSLTPWELKVLTEGLDYEGELHKLTLNQLAWRRRTVRNKLNGDAKLFMQEYPSTAREAFLVSGDCFFDTENLEEYDAVTTKPRRFRLHETTGGILRVPDAQGELWMWKKPEPSGEYVIFADTATGKQSSTRESYYVQGRERGGRDFSCAWVFDVNTREYVACLHGRILPEVFALKLTQLGYMYSNPHPVSKSNRVPALVGVERNHKSGETVLKLMKRDFKYPTLYHDRPVNRSRNKPRQELGWVTTEAKRTVMLDEFAAVLRNGEVAMPDAATIWECRTFVRGEDGKPEAEEGCHDDRVIAAAGALQMSKVYSRPRLKKGPPAPQTKRSDSATGLFDYGEESHYGNREEEDEFESGRAFSR